MLYKSTYTLYFKEPIQIIGNIYIQFIYPYVHLKGRIISLKSLPCLLQTIANTLIFHLLKFSLLRFNFLRFNFLRFNLLCNVRPSNFQLSHIEPCQGFLIFFSHLIQGKWTWLEARSASKIKVGISQRFQTFLLIKEKP